MKNIAFKLLIVPFFLIIILLSVYFGYNYESDKVMKRFEFMYLNSVVPISELKRLSDLYAVDVIDSANKKKLGLYDKEETYAVIKASIVASENIWKRYVKEDFDENEKLIAKTLSDKLVRANSQIPILVQGHRDEKINDNQFIIELYLLIDDLSVELDQLIDLQLEKSITEYELAYSELSLFNKWAGILSILAALGVSYFSYYLTKRELRNLPDIVESLKHLSKGKLLRREFSASHNELDSVKDSIHSLTSKLGEEISHSQSRVTQISTEQENSLKLIADSHSNSELELTHLEQVATAASELVMTVSDVADNAIQVEVAGLKVNEIIELSQQVLNQTSKVSCEVGDSIIATKDAVNRLHTYAETVGSVVDVIANICEQTNILTLNALVEAAKLGEQGRGFAVVVDEVRALTAKTQRSTIHIQEAIAQLQIQSREADASLDYNVELIARISSSNQELGLAFELIIDQLAHIFNANSVVTTVSKEQSAAITDISLQIEKIRSLVCKNISVMSHTASSYKSVSLLTIDLKKQLHYFQVN